MKWRKKKEEMYSTVVLLYDVLLLYSIIQGTVYCIRSRTVHLPVLYHPRTYDTLQSSRVSLNTLSKASMHGRQPCEYRAGHDCSGVHMIL